MIFDRIVRVFFNTEKQITNVIIHMDAIEASITALTSTNIPMSYTMITGIQIDMVIKLGRLMEVEMDKREALAVIEGLLGGVIYFLIANQMIKYIPILGNFLNITVAMITTELIGWETVYMLRENDWFDAGNRTQPN